MTMNMLADSVHHHILCLPGVKAVAHSSCAKAAAVTCALASKAPRAMQGCLRRALIALPVNSMEMWMCSPSIVEVNRCGGILNLV